MTSLHANAETRVQKDHLHAVFTGCGPTATHIGAEAEFFICNKSGTNFASPDEVQRLVKGMQDKGHLIQTEACGVLEINTPPFETNHMRPFYDECAHAEHDLKIMAHDHGHVILNTAVPPFISQGDAEQAVIPRERIRDMIAAVKRLLPPDALRVGLLTASCQVSIDYKDPQDLYKKLHRGYALSPLLIHLFASDTGRIEGQPIHRHIRSDLYRSYDQEANGIPSYLKDSFDGETLIRAHLDHLCKTPLLYYYDSDQVVYPATLSETFNSLSTRGLNTAQNFEAAESFLYHDIKFKPLPNGKRRLEFRLADTGFGHMKAAGALISTLVCNDATAAVFDKILKSFGFCGNLSDDLPMLIANRESAVHNPASDHVSFGNGTLRGFVTAIRQQLLPRLKRDSETAQTLQDLLDPTEKPLRAHYQNLTDQQLMHSIIV